MGKVMLKAKIHARSDVINKTVTSGEKEHQNNQPDNSSKKNKTKE